MSIFLWVFVVGLGCAPDVTQDTMPQRFAEVQCVLYKRCERARFDGEYGTMAQCEESVQKEYEQRIEDMSVEDPPFNVEKAQKCLDVLNESTCEEYWNEYIDPSGDTYLLCYDETWSL
jgi:hypothetical protein